MKDGKGFLEETEMANMTSRKKAILVSSVVAIAVAVVALVAYPAYTVSAQADYVYALNEGNWAIAEEFTATSDQPNAVVHTVAVYAKGYAFQRIDEETLKQFKAETNLTITIGPKEDDAPRVNVTGTLKVNDKVYSIENGTAVLGTKRRVLLIRCEGVDEEGNRITLKFGAVYFWWGGRAYALRSKALLQTADKPMLLLQRGIARID
jgi:flagellar basal body-associated protein FliL